MQPLDNAFPQRAGKAAEDYFRIDVLNCAESVLKAVLEEAGRPCPLELVRAASAFGRGMGGAGCCCGALIGGQMALGCLLGRVRETGEPPEACGRLARVLHDRFVKQNRAACCPVLHRGMPFGSPEQFDSCAVRTGKAAALAAQLLLEAQSAPAVPAAP